MSDPRDFNMGRLPGVEAVLATGVPESCSMADALEALQRERDELREQVARLLEENGQHQGLCLAWRLGNRFCECGLAEALTPPEVDEG